MANPLNLEFLARVGGEPRLRQILRLFYEELAKDLLVGFFFDGKDLDLIAKHQGDFILRAAGAVSHYQGKSPVHAHEKIPPILAGHFDRRIVILEQILLREGISPEDTLAWVRFEKGFRKQIVCPESR